MPYTSTKRQKEAVISGRGRFYSRYINSEEYYYTLIRYIEQNPIEAGIANKIGEYPYTLGAVIANQDTPIPCSLKSKLIEELNYENIQDIIGVKLDTKSMELLDEIKKQDNALKNPDNILKR